MRATVSAPPAKHQLDRVKEQSRCVNLIIAFSPHCTAPENLRKGTINITGHKFERLTALGYVGHQNRKALWLCRCDCGNFTFAESYALRTGRWRSCGCYFGNRGKNRRTHGMSHTAIHNRWLGMLTRCSNPKAHQSKDYIGRGILVCQGLHKFETFYALMGDAPKKKELDRIDNDGNYSCGSCEECLSKNWLMNLKWSTREEQARNKRTTRWITIGDKTQILTDWIKESGVCHSTAWQRMNRGWTPEQALGFKERPSRKELIAEACSYLASNPA